MDIKEAIKKVTGEHEIVEVDLAGEKFEIKAYPLNYEEYLKAFGKLPLEIAPSTEEDLRKMESGEIVPDLGEADVTSFHNHVLYVIMRTMKKNFPKFDVDDLKADIRVFHQLRPVYDKVWDISQPSEELTKKKTLE